VDIILVRDCFWLRTYRFGNQSTGSLNCPKRKPLSCFNPRILKVDEIKVTVVTRSDERFFLSENKGLVGTAILREAYSNGDAVPVAQPVDRENFCGNGGHWCFLPSTHAGNAERNGSARSGRTDRDITCYFQVATHINYVPAE